MNPIHPFQFLLVIVQLPQCGSRIELTVVDVNIQCAANVPSDKPRLTALIHDADVQVESSRESFARTFSEISIVVEARHDSVKRTIERLASRDVIEFPPVVEIPTTTKRITEYRVGKRDSYVIVAQLSPEFTARLVDRWQELEKQVAQPQVPQSFAEALRLAADTQ
ncbi:Rha family transcriptional regulator [Halomonas sp. 18H]|nr:Rha family transcriptional regulator [Halomonas sp. 18H]MCW4147920.1 Rha family transcriptional regulator [Halomonas sp. 18H]